jgi:hypothetical protein
MLGRQVIYDRRRRKKRCTNLSSSHHPLTHTTLSLSFTNMLANMYRKWITDDNQDLALTKEQIKEIKEQIDQVKASQEAMEDLLSQKEQVLAGKEDVLSVRLVFALYRLFFIV